MIFINLPYVFQRIELYTAKTYLQPKATYGNTLFYRFPADSEAKLRLTTGFINITKPRLTLSP